MYARGKHRATCVYYITDYKKFRKMGWIRKIRVKYRKAKFFRCIVIVIGKLKSILLVGNNACRRSGQPHATWRGISLSDFFHGRYLIYFLSSISFSCATLKFTIQRESSSPGEDAFQLCGFACTRELFHSSVSEMTPFSLWGER